MGLRRGFKTEANRGSVELRRVLGLRAHDPLCPWKLAQHLKIRVDSLSDWASDNEALRYFLSPEGCWEFSGATFKKGARRVILINDSHPRKRQASDLSHELSHCILNHEPIEQLSQCGLRQYDLAAEEEAEWLGPALLVSEEAALYIARRGFTLAIASDIYGATEDVVRFRLNKTGAFRRVGRAA